MAFLDLHEGILEEFESYAVRVRYSEVNQLIRADRWSRRRAWVEAQNERYKAARAKTRAARLVKRPPCPHCSNPVVRDAKVRVDGRGRGAKIPTYCSDKCARAAKFARWYAKHGAERNERRRVAA